MGSDKNNQIIKGFLSNSQSENSSSKKECYDAVIKQVTVLVSNKEQAHNTVEEGIQRLWKKIKKGKTIEGDIFKYLYGICRRIVYKTNAKIITKSKEELYPHNAPEYDENGGKTPINDIKNSTNMQNEIEYKDQLALVLSEIKKMKDIDREILFLSIDGYPPRDIATELNLKDSTYVRQRLLRARKHLKKKLKNNFPKDFLFLKMDD